MRCEVVEAIKREKLIVIVRGVEEEKLLPLAEAMYEGGIRLLEITFSQNGKISDERTAGMIKMLAEAMSGRMYFPPSSTRASFVVTDPTSIPKYTFILIFYLLPLYIG